MPKGVHAALLQAEFPEQGMKMATQEGRVPDGMTTAAHKQQAALAIAKVLLDQFQERGLHDVDCSIGVLRLRGLNLPVVQARSASRESDSWSS